MKFPTKLIEKTHALAEYRPSRKDIITVIGVTAMTVTGVLLEVKYGPEANEAPKGPSMVVDSVPKTITPPANT